MKKLLLSTLVLFVANVSFSQVVLKVISPTNISGSLTHVYVDSAQGTSPWFNVPDMDSAYNVLIDTLALAYDDGTNITSNGVNSADTACCGPVIADVAGKIAMIYRGDCEFGTKALMAQNAGAVGVIIVNLGGAPLSMGAGGDGNSVTIPVTMIGPDDGEMLRQAVASGQDVVMYFGAQYGYYTNDIGIPKETVLLPRASSIPSAIATNDTEFNVPLGCWVYNYGTSDYTGATVTANIDYNGSSIFNNVSTSFNVASGDSSYVTFPTFSQVTYPNGKYELSYTINHATADETPDNDVISFVFNINDEYYSLSPLDTLTGDPLHMASVRIPPADANSFIKSTSCLVFADSNASRLAVRGISFSAGAYDPLTPTTLDGEYIEIVAYEWNDNFADMTDPNFSNYAVNPSVVDIATTDYSYTSDAQNVTIGVDFPDAIVLSDNQRYLFCMTSYTQAVSFGYDNSISYDFNINNYAQPLTMIDNGTQWYTGIQGVEPTLSLRVLDAAAAGVEENLVEVKAYPNPASDIITIPLTGLDGEANLMITDMTGKIMSTKLVYLSGNDKLQVNVSDLSSGFYTFTIRFDNGAVSKFNVAVTK